MKNFLFYCFAYCLLFTLNSCEKNSPGEAHKTTVEPEEELFEWLSPNHTGIDFVQTITEEYRYNFSQDPNIFNGGGVAILDVNNDELPDLFFTSRLQPCRLYLNQGNFNFKDISAAAGIAEYIGIKTGVTVVDINSDGWDDVYVCRTFLSPIPERRNLLFVNQKNGTFLEKAAEYGLDDPSPTQHAHFFDYDLDGDLDCYILNHPVAYSTINNMDFLPTAKGQLASARQPDDEYESDKLMRNDGGKFIDVTAEAGLVNRAWGLSVNSTDLNNDGWPDLYVANDFIMPDFFYENNGDGTFTEKGQSYFGQMTNHSMGTEVADLTNDGLCEVISVDMLGETWERRHRQLTTMKRKRFDQLLKKGYGNQQMRNTLQLNLGEGAFAEIGCLAGIHATEWSWAPLAADFDLDGRKDLLITNGVRRDLNDIDFFAYTADSINRSGGIRESVFPSFEDFSSLMPSDKIANRVFRNTGKLQMEDVTEEWGFSQPTFSNGAAYADLDLDGDLDIVVHNVEDPPFIYRNRAAENKKGNWLQIECRGPKENPHGIGAKISVIIDGETQYHEVSNVRGFYSSVQPIFQVGLGDKKVVEGIVVRWPSGKAESMQNVAANQKIVFDVQNAGSSLPSEGVPNPILKEVDVLQFTHQENNFDDFDRERLLPRRYSRLGPAMAVGDMDGDGLEDVFIGGASGQPGLLFVQTKTGSFSKSIQPSLDTDASHEDTGALFFDADGDGDFDLYVASGGNESSEGALVYQDRFYENENGKLVRQENSLPRILSSTQSIAAHDIDGDGDPDLVVGGRVTPGRFPVPPQSFVLKNEQGKFSDWTLEVFPEFSQIGMVTDLHFADFDGDQNPELIVAGEWMSIQIYKIKDGKFDPSHFELPHSSGWWNCIETNDLDGDGDLDFVAGNLGLNSRFEKGPLELYAKDFDSNGSIDPIACVSENGRLLPVPMRDDLIAQLPRLKKKFVRNAHFAAADIKGVFSENELKDALHLTAETLATTWFENQNGKWVAHPLPDRAQIATTHAALADDFNGDGLIDILMLGNDSGFDVETGPIATSPGCLLLGGGKGVFQPLTPSESGLLAQREARALKKVKLAEGKALYLVGNNDGKVHCFIQAED